MGNLYLSDAISNRGGIDKIIEDSKNNKILIEAGVGAGKSHWVRNVLSKQGKVLFITSRRAKVDEDVRHSRFVEITSSDLTDNQYIATNAKIENLVRQYYLHDTSISNLLDEFDYIVVDEIHSIAADSTFARSAYALERFIYYAAEQGKVVIGMTGTPEPMENYFERHNWRTIKLRDTCRYVHPSRISLIEKEEVIDVMQESLRTKRIVYFVNMREEIPQLINKVVRNNLLTKKEIAVIVGSNARKTLKADLKEALKSTVDNVWEQSNNTYNSIINKQRIPEDCRLLICTSSLREGVDIKNDDIEIFCENHILTNIIQFFGRVRSDGGTAHIIVDAKQHNVNPYEAAYLYTKNVEKDNLNNYLENIRSQGRNEVLRFADFFEKGNIYIGFDCITACFGYLGIRYWEEQRIKSKHNKNRNNEPIWKEELKQYCANLGIKLDNIVDRHQTQEMRELQEELERLADSGERFIVSSGQNDHIKNMINRAFNTNYSQPSKLNAKLTEAGIPYCIISRNNHDVYYWKILRN